MINLLRSCWFAFILIIFSYASVNQTLAMLQQSDEDAGVSVRAQSASQRTLLLPHQVGDDIQVIDEGASALSSVDQLQHPPKLIDVFLRQLETNLAKRRVLSLDGGGVRGAFTAQVLARMEVELKEIYPGAARVHIKDIFQGGFAGTSTGSFIALGLSYPGPDGPYPAERIVQFYEDKASAMFSGCCAFGNCVKSLKCPQSSGQRFLCGIRTLLSCFGCCGCCYNCGGACGPRYTRTSLDRELKILLGTTIPLKDALVPVQVTTYDITLGGGVIYLGSQDPQTNEYTFDEAAAASSAAPTYYPGAAIGVKDPARRKYKLCVDGGLFQNNPILRAMLQAHVALQDGSDLGDLTAVSIGTGQAAGAFNDETLRYAGSPFWAQAAIEIGMDGSSKATHLALEGIFGDRNYFRMQAFLSDGLLEMDEPRNVGALIKEANKFCDDPGTKFNQFLQRLREERDFIAHIRRLYGELSNDEFIRILVEFDNLVGLTSVETQRKISMLSQRQPDAFSVNVPLYFNDARLLKILSITIRKDLEASIERFRQARA